MKKMVGKLAKLMLCSVVALSVAAPAFAESYEMNFPGPYFDRHPTVVRVFKPWTKEISKLSKGDIEITYFAPNTVCPEGEIMDSVAKGTVEMGGNTFTRNAGRLVAGELGQLPMLSRSTIPFALGWWDVTQKYPHLFPELEGDIKLMFVWSSALSQVHTTKKPVRKLEDLKGLKIIGWTPVTLDFLKLLGAIPMFQSGADTYLALERGMADGVMCPFAPLRSQKLTDVLKYHTVIDVSLTPFWGGINRKLFNSMSPEQQKLLVETTGPKLTAAAAKSIEDGALEDIEWIKKQGKSEIIEISDEERARWAKALAPMTENSIKKVVASGIAEKDARELHAYFLERIAYHTANAKK